MTTKKSRKKISENKESVNEEVVTQEGDNFDDSFYKGKGGCYTLDENGRRVPVKEIDNDDTV